MWMFFVIAFWKGKIMYTYLCVHMHKLYVRKYMIVFHKIFAVMFQKAQVRWENMGDAGKERLEKGKQ